MFVPYASEIWTKSYGPNYTKFWAFWPKKKQTNKQTKTKAKQKQQQQNGFFNAIFWQRVDTISEDVSVAEIIFNAKLLI